MTIAPTSFVGGHGWRVSINVHASYRFRLDPLTGDSGPLPVWSKEALKSNIISPAQVTDG